MLERSAELRAAYDAKAVRYARREAQPFWLAAPVGAVQRVLTETRADVLLDIGCGSGVLTRRIADACPLVRCLGLDLSPKLIALAQAVPSDAVFLERDLLREPDLLAALRLKSRRVVISAIWPLAYYDPASAFAARLRGLLTHPAVVGSVLTVHHRNFYGHPAERGKAYWTVAELQDLLPGFVRIQGMQCGPLDALARAGWTGHLMRGADALASACLPWRALFANLLGTSVSPRTIT